MADEINEQNEEQSEGIKNLRKHAKDLEERARLAEERVAQFETQQRQEALAKVFIENGLSAQASRLYPADGEVSGAAVAAWASENGIVPVTRAPETTMSREQEILERHNDFVRGAFARPSETTSLDELARQTYSKAAQSYESDYMPTPQEEADLKADIKTVNKIHAQAEVDVRMGRMPKQTEGFGGLTSPPYYADLVAQRQARP